MSKKSISVTDGLTLKNITFPQLNDSQFADRLEETFSNINYNFAALANHDFIKGEDGNSIVIENIPVNGNDPIALSLKNYVLDMLGSESDKVEHDSIQLNYLDNFVGDIQVICKIDSYTGEKIPVSSLQYAFLDGRFWNNNVGKIDPNLFSGIDDLTCLIVYNGTCR